jgi:hypothetical protein
MKTNLILTTILTAGMAMAQVVIPDGTRIRVRLAQNISSESAEVGQVVDFTVNQEVRIGDAVVVASGAPAQGSIIQAEGRRRLGRGGKLAFSVEKVQTVDGNWAPVRYTPQKAEGKGHIATTTVLTGAIAVAFLPAAPIGLLVKGKEATFIKGRTYEVFVDENTTVMPVAASTPMSTRLLPQSAVMPVRAANGGFANNGGLSSGINMAGNQNMISNAAVTNAPAGSAALTVNASRPGADIEVDGMFVGNAPSSLQVAAGAHTITVRYGSNTWQRQIQVTAGGQVNINAELGGSAVHRAVAR